MSQPRYLQIVQQLRNRIQNGEYPPNTRIPTENELSVSMGVSRPTVRQALNLLEQEGRLTRVKGSGTYVTEPKIQHESTRFVIGYQEESRERHNHLHTSVLALQKEKPGKLAAKALGLAEGERVTRIGCAGWKAWITAAPLCTQRCMYRYAFSRKWMNKTLRMHPFTKCWTAVG